MATGLAAVTLGGCAFLPNDGPDDRRIIQGANSFNSGLVLADLSFRVTQTIGEVPPRVPPSLAGTSSSAPNNLIREGDGLAVSIFEPSGASLFQTSNSDQGLAPLGSAQDVLPRVVVNPQGFVDVPFAGSVRVAGLTPEQAAVAIRDALHGRVANPQVLVSVISSNANSVSILGEVRTVGRYPLTTNGDRLLDIIALAGGPTKPYQDIDVQIVRDDQTVSIPMAELLRSSVQNIRLAPKDQIRLLPNERKYSVFGALGHISQTPMVDDRVSLANAISRAGGLDTWSADNSAVFVFRFERPEVVKALGLHGVETPRGVPTVYKLDMRTDPAGFLVADTFNIENGDLIYVPRADLVSVTKFMQTVNAFAQTGYSIRVTGVP